MLVLSSNLNKLIKITEEFQTFLYLHQVFHSNILRLAWSKSFFVFITITSHCNPTNYAVGFFRLGILTLFCSPFRLIISLNCSSIIYPLGAFIYLTNPLYLLCIVEQWTRAAAESASLYIGTICSEITRESSHDLPFRPCILESPTHYITLILHFPPV